SPCRTCCPADRRCRTPRRRRPDDRRTRRRTSQRLHSRGRTASTAYLVDSPARLAARPRVPQDRVFVGRGSREPGALRWLRALGPGDSVTGTSRRVCMAATLTSKRLSVRDETDAMEMAYDKGWSDGLPVVP